MAYTKQNFKDGQTLTAAMLTQIEDGIVQNEENLKNIQLTPGPQGPQGEKGEPGTPADLTGYATEEFVTQKIAEAELGGGGEVPDLSGYLTETEADGKYQPKGNYQPAGEYITETEADGKYQPAGEYITETEADGKYQPAGEYITETEADGKYQPKGNYATESFVTDKITEAQLGGGNGEAPDLSGYLTETEADGKYQPKGNYLSEGVQTVPVTFEQGNVTSSGETTSGTAHNQWIRSGYIDKFPLTVSCPASAAKYIFYIALYDSEKKLLRYFGGDSSNQCNAGESWTVPKSSEYAYARIRVRNYATAQTTIVPADNPVVCTTETTYMTSDEVEEYVTEQVTGRTNALKGKVASFIGDSRTTYSGYVPSGYTSHYPKYDVTNVSQMWWKQVLDGTGMTLGVNNSYSGGYIVKPEANASESLYACSNERTSNLGNPDIIIIYNGVNDWNGGKTLGEYNGKTLDFPTDGSTFKEACAIMIAKLQKNYPNADIWICTNPYCCPSSPGKQASEVPVPICAPTGLALHEFNQVLLDTAKMFGCGVIDFTTCGVNYTNVTTYTDDYDDERGLHYNAAGNKLLSAIAIKTLNNYYK